MPPSYLQQWKAPDGTPLAMRCIHAGDGTRIADGLRRLSPEARQRRFLGGTREIGDAFVRALTETDRALAYGLLVVRPHGSDEILVAGGRIVAGDALAVWEFALIVGDAWQGQGVGRCLLTALIAEAGRRRLQRLIGHIAIDNRPMLKLARSCGFLVDRDGQDASTCIATLDVGARPEAKSPGLLGWLRA